MRIPESPEMPELRGRFLAFVLSAFRLRAFRGSRGHAAQQKNKRSHNRLRSDQFPVMKQIFGERENHRTGKEQIAERNPFKRAKRGPRARQFAAPRNNSRRVAAS